MNETKLISVRVPADVLKKLDLLAAKFDYYKRSDLINASIRLMVVYDTSQFARKALKFWPEFCDKLEKLELEYHREHK